MAKRFRGRDIVKEIDEAMDKGLARFLFNTQRKLSRATPVDTGRMASSWFLGMDQPSRQVEPERDAPGPVTVTRDYTPVEITMKHDWYISNNLPYAFRVAYDPVYAKGGRVGGADWFTRIENTLTKDLDRSMDFFLRKVK